MLSQSFLKCTTSFFSPRNEWKYERVDLFLFYFLCVRLKNNKKEFEGNRWVVKNFLSIDFIGKYLRFIVIHQSI